jgi:hypothetical protein
LFKLAKLVAVGCSLAGLQALGYLVFTWQDSEHMLHISGADIRAGLALQAALALTLPLWFALFRAALFGGLFRNPRYTSATLLRRWIQLQLDGQIPDDLTAARRLQGRDS